VSDKTEAEFIIIEPNGKILRTDCDAADVESTINALQRYNRKDREAFLAIVVDEREAASISELIQRRRVADTLRVELREHQLTSLINDRPTFRRLLALRLDLWARERSLDYFQAEAKKLEAQLEAVKKTKPKAKGGRNGKAV